MTSRSGRFALCIGTWLSICAACGATSCASSDTSSDASGIGRGAAASDPLPVPTVSDERSDRPPDAHARGAASAGAPNLASGEATFDPAVAPELEVKRAKTGHLLVRPRINGRDAGWFIFDTGAGICVVSTPHAAELELTPAGDIDALGTGGAGSAQLYRASKLELGPLTSNDHPVMLTDLSFLRAHLDEEISGVIGFGVLSRCVTEIDIETPRVALHDPKRYAFEKARWTPMSIDKRIPCVTATFEGREGRFHLDTGANTSVTFNEPAVRKWKLLDERALTDGKVGGVGGFVATKRGTLASFELGGVRRENVPAEFVVEAKGAMAESSRDGQIGQAFLRGFVVCLDYAGERIALRERPDASVNVPAASK